MYERLSDKERERETERNRKVRKKENKRSGRRRIERSHEREFKYSLRVFLLQMRPRPPPTGTDITSAFFRAAKEEDKPS